MILTQKQSVAVREMRATYGEPDMLLVNQPWEDVAQGELVRMVWWGQRRELFILSNGERLFWTTDGTEVLG